MDIANVEIHPLLRTLAAHRYFTMWAATQGSREPEDLWGTCPDGSWLGLMLATAGTYEGHGSPDHRRAVLLATHFAVYGVQRAASVRPQASELLPLLEEVAAWAQGADIDVKDVYRRISELTAELNVNAPSGPLIPGLLSAFFAARATLVDTQGCAIDDYQAPRSPAGDVAAAIHSAAEALYESKPYASYSEWYVARHKQLMKFADEVREQIPTAPKLPEINDVMAGMTEKEAHAIGTKKGFAVRAVERDGEALCVTADFRPDRRNIALKNGIVTSVTKS